MANSPSPPSDPAPAARPARALPIVERPLFWLVLIGALISVPLLKGLGAELPDPPPGADRAPMSFALPDDQGREVALADLAGRLVVVTELAYANAAVHDEPLMRLRKLRKRLRGLGDSVTFVVLAHGVDGPTLARFVDEHTARKLQNVWLVDEDRAVFTALAREAGAPSAQLLLLDRHGRLRALYSEDPRELDELVSTAGILANWRGADPPPSDA